MLQRWICEGSWVICVVEGGCRAMRHGMGVWGGMKFFVFVNYLNICYAYPILSFSSLFCALGDPWPCLLLISNTKLKCAEFITGIRAKLVHKLCTLYSLVGFSLSLSWEYDCCIGVTHW